MTVLVDDRDGIATVRIDRPEARNALDPATLAALTGAARSLGRRTDIRAVILTGGNSFFSAGVDLRAPAVAADAPLIDRREAARAGPELCRAWEEIEAITIAAIDGFCVGGAFALALACDFRVAGADAMLRLPEVPLGMNMSWQTLPRLAALVGPARAKRIVLFGEPVDAETAYGWGLADEIAPAGQALSVARRWATKVAALPPVPVRMTKEAINRAVGAAGLTASFMDRDQHLLTASSADYAEGIDAFLGKRAPRFTGD